MTPTVTSQVYRRAPCRLATLPLVCKRFRRLLLDPEDRHLWSELTIVAHDFKGESAELNHLRFLAFLRSHLHQVEVATLLHDTVVRSTAYWMCSRTQSVGDDTSFRFLRIVCKMMCKRTHTITVKFIAQAFMVHGSPMQVEVNSHVDGSYWESYTVPRALEHGAILLAFAPHLTRISLETGFGIPPSQASRLLHLLQPLRHLKHLTAAGPPQAADTLHNVLMVRQVTLVQNAVSSRLRRSKCRPQSQRD